MTAKLRYTAHDGVEVLTDLSEHGDSVIIGRNPDCSIYANSLSVSRNHSKVFREGNVWYILDLGSSNGTFLNGKQIEREELRDRDALRCGEFPLVFFWEPDAEEAYSSEEVRALQAELADKEELLARQSETITALEDRLSEVGNELSGAKERAREVDPLKEIIKNLQDERDKLKAENRKQYEQVNEQQLDINKIEITLRQERERNDEISRTAMISAENLKTTLQDRDELRRRVSHLEEQNHDINEDVNQKLIEIDRLEKQIEVFEQQTDGGNRDVRLLSEKNAALKEVIGEKEKLVVELKDKIEDQRQDMDGMKADLDMQRQLSTETKGQADKVEEMRTRLRERDERIAEASALMANQKTELDRLKGELSRRDEESVRRNLDDERSLFSVKEDLASRDKEIFQLRKQIDQMEDKVAASKSAPAGPSPDVVAKLRSEVARLKESNQDFQARSKAAEARAAKAEEKAKKAAAEVAAAAAAAPVEDASGARGEVQKLRNDVKRLKRAARRTGAGDLAGDGTEMVGELRKELDAAKQESERLKLDLRKAQQASAGGGGGGGEERRRAQELEKELDRVKRDLRRAEQSAASASAGGGGGGPDPATERELKKLETENKRLQRDLDQARSAASDAPAPSGPPKEKLAPIQKELADKGGELRGALRNVKNHMLTLETVLEEHPEAAKAIEDEDLLGQLNFELGNMEDSSKSTREQIDALAEELA